MNNKAEQPPAGELTKEMRLTYELRPKVIEGKIVAKHIFDLCDRLDASSAHLREYGGQRCTAVCSQCKKINHWCLLGQGHTGEHIHYCQFRTLEASRKELVEACKELIKANEYARCVSLRDEAPRGSVWGDARSHLDTTKLKAEIAIAKHKQS